MCAKCWVVTAFSCHLVFDVLFYERKDCPLKGDSQATIKLLASWKCLDTLKNTFSSTKVNPQMLVVNINNSQKMPLWLFNRPY